MRTPRQIYAQYRIMPSLQLHQLRAASVAKLICRNTKAQVREEDVVLECLFHDMGNIVKFDLAYFPESLQPEGREYWEGVKKDFLEKYGPEQHAANAAIAREIGLSQHIIDIMSMSGFSKIRHMLENGSLESKISQYADLRVAPHGVVSLEERLQDFGRRYAKKGDSAQEEALHASEELEKQIFALTSIQPADITDAHIAPILEELWGYTVA